MRGLGFKFEVQGFGFWVLGFGFWVLGFGFCVLGFGFENWDPPAVQPFRQKMNHEPESKTVMMHGM
jgi:hypothetical protein